MTLQGPASSGPPLASTTMVPARAISPGPNDRKTFDREALEELAASIRDHGLAQPPTVRPKGQGYEIVAGERRYRAMVDVLAWSEIPCMVRELTDEAASAIMLAENVQRADLDPLEEARAYRNRMDRFGYPQSEVARLANVAADRVRRRLALLSLEPSIAQLVSRRQLPLTYAACMTSLDSNRQIFALKAYNASPMSIDAFRALCSRLVGEQQQETMFDASSFLQIEDYVSEACLAVNNEGTLDDMEPVGLKEIAEMLGVQENTARVWRKRGVLPEPKWWASGVPLWNRADIIKWHEKRDARKHDARKN